MENIFNLAFECLTESSLDKKISLSIDTVKAMSSGNMSFDTYIDKNEYSKPGRPSKPVLIDPKDVPRRNLQTLEGRAAMAHSFAHIEFNAINLAWDLIYRFQNMSEEFYFDWVKVAGEETKHFNLLRGYLNNIGYDYGDFPGHEGLWTIAEKTKHDILLKKFIIYFIF